jgi:hypothetical protein
MTEYNLMLVLALTLILFVGVVAYYERQLDKAETLNRAYEKLLGIDLETSTSDDIEALINAHLQRTAETDPLQTFETYRRWNTPEFVTDRDRTAEVFDFPTPGPLDKANS